MPWLRYHADSFLLARPVRPCFSCGSTSPGVQVILPARHLRTRRTATGRQTDIGGHPVALFYVARFSTLALDAILHLTGPSFAFDRDVASAASYFAAHCEKCGALLRDRPDQVVSLPDTASVHVHVPIVAVGPIEELALPQH